MRDLSNVLLPLVVAVLLASCSGGGDTADTTPDSGDKPVPAIDADVVIPMDNGGTNDVVDAEPGDTGTDVSGSHDASPEVADVPTDAAATVGQSCTGPDDCVTGLCLDTGAGPMCTVFCVEDCPADWTCMGTNLMGPEIVFICVPTYWMICMPCTGDQQCKTGLGVCAELGSEGRFCTTGCSTGDDCPPGFGCNPNGEGESVCMPDSGSCQCRDVKDEGLEQDCDLVNEHGTCQGTRICVGDSGWGSCTGQEPASEICNGQDEDCDGQTDEVFPDLDMDGKADCVDDDDDGDGVPDSEDNCPTAVNTDQADMDKDDTGDACDEDADGDGFVAGPDCNDQDPAVNPDAEEECDLEDNNCNDVVDEGFPDTDSDGLKDCVDYDDDGDGIPDEDDNCPMTSNSGQADMDLDGVGDACDEDDDNDGIIDTDDNCPMTSNPDQADMDMDGMGDACDGDDDNDAVPDDYDNCPLVPNPLQEDLDQDGTGDACDGDDDNDTVMDGDDNCPMTSNPDQADLDLDGMGDACDGDDDNDGVPDPADNCPGEPNPLQKDNDEDELGDVCDSDDDNDGIPDGTDNCPLVPNAGQEDCDTDLAGDVCDDDDDNDGSPDDVDCGPCDQSVFPGADEACNGVDDDCNGDTDDGVADLCHPYSCDGTSGCATHCSEALPCASDHFCDTGDMNANGTFDECLEKMPGGSPCTESAQCKDGYCGNGYCCGAQGESCCADDTHCAFLDAAPVCDAPAQCIGHRTDGQCNGTFVCKAVQIPDASGCSGSLCAPGNYCVAAEVHQNRYCDSQGNCSVIGALIQNCMGSNPCCDYSCTGGSCGSAFKSYDAVCLWACYQNPVACLCF